MTVERVIFTDPVRGADSSTPGIVEGSETVNGQATLITADMTTRELLEGIYTELRKLNLRQEDAFEIEIKDEDVSNG